MNFQLKEEPTLVQKIARNFSAIGRAYYSFKLLGGTKIAFSRQIFAIILLVVVMAISPLAQASDEGLATDPLGQDRLLIMCLPNDREATPEEMGFIYALDWEAFAERDLRVIGINRQFAFDYRADKIPDAYSTTYTISRFPINAERIKERVNCRQNFEKVLIGKDTGVKARWKNNFSQEDLFNQIDAMPMRRFEMRERKRND